jgi:hypothetical protein
MLTITATNFGVNPAYLNINEYHEKDLLVLEGDISVDTTAEAYAGIRPMALTVADLPFGKSRIGTALVTAASEGANYCTLAKVWISDKNTICIGKILPYKSLGSYTIHLNTLLIPTMKTGAVSLNRMTSYVPQFNKGTGDGVEIHTVMNAHWIMFVLKADNLEFDAEDQTIEMQLLGFPSDIAINPPIIYNESLWSNLGSKYYPAYLRNGVLTISKADAADEPDGTGSKFTRIISIR